MRFLLVNPSYPMSERPSSPLGLAYLGAALEQVGVEVKIIDLVVFPYGKDMLESILKSFSPHFVGITAVTMNFYNAIEILQDVKCIDPEILTVMGGPHVTFCARDTMRAFPECDFIALGEGEATIVELAKESDNGRDWRKIKGILCRNGSELVSTGMRKHTIEVNSLPIPARQLVPLGRYRALGMPISMTTSRGCPYKCTFCLGRKMGGAKVRYRDPHKVVDELEYLSRLGFPQINIVDDLFTANKRHCVAVCEEITNRGLRIEWACFARADTVSREILSKMRLAGCHTISFGVESANPAILKTIKKGITLEQVISAVNMCVDVGVAPHASFILGLPGETPDTLMETTAFGRRLKEMGASYGFHLLAPFPGTEVRKECHELGIKILTNDWSQYHANRAIVETSSVNRRMLDEIVIEWENKFNEWLEEIKKRMERGNASGDEAWQIIRLEHTVLIYDLMMGRAIEEKGLYLNESKPISQLEALETLVNRIVSSTKYSKKQLRNTLSFAVGQDYLRWREDKGQVRWEWVDFL